MLQSLQKHASLNWLKMLLVVVMSLSFIGAYAQGAPFELTKFYPDQTTPPQQLKENTSIYVYLTNKTTEALTITALDMSLTQNGTEVAADNITLKKSTKVAAGMQGTPNLKVMDFPEFFDKCAPGEVTLAVYGVTYTDASGATQHYVDAANPLGSVVYKVSSNPTVTSTTGFESKVLYSFYAEDATDGVLTLNFSEPVVETGKIQSYLEYGDANTTVVTEVPNKLSADGMSLTVDFRGLDLSYDAVSQGNVFKDDNGNEYHPTKISLVVTGMETADGTKISTKMVAPNGSVVIVTGAQFSWSYKEEQAPNTGGGEDPQPPVEEVLTVTCNIPEGINLIVDGVNDDIDAEFVGNTATIKGEVAFVRIYNVDPYTIVSVTVDGVEAEAEEEGAFYFIEMTEGVKNIDVKVEKQKVENITFMAFVEGLENFDKLFIMNKYGETGKILATKETIEAEGGTANVECTNLDLPLQIYATWEDGKDYEMLVAIDGEVVEPVNAGSTSAQYMDINIENDQFLTISLTAAPAPAQPLKLTVNEADGVRVMADVEIDGDYDIVDVEFTEGQAEVEGAQIIRIYPVEPYAIVSVKVDGQEVEVGEDGESYFIEVTEDTKDIAIEVKKQEVENITFMAFVEGLENFDKLFIMNKYGETGKILATKETIEAEGGMANVECTNLDLPLQIYATWEDGKDYEMLVAIDGEVVEPVNAGSTSAQYMDINIENDQFLTISLTAAPAPAQPLKLTVNEADGVRVMADVEIDGDYDIVDVEFTEGQAEVEGAQIIRIYPVEPYAIVSVKVDGQEVEVGEDGESYFIEVTEDTKDIAIEVKKQEVENITFMAFVEGLENFDKLFIMNKYGETGKILATKETIEAEGGMANVECTNLDLPLQIYATWEDGKDYEMLVAIDGEVVEPVNAGSTSAQYMDINIANDQFLTISLTAAPVPAQPIAITVNEAAGVQVLVDTEDDNYKVEFAEGKAEVEGAQYIRIYPVDPYAIVSVKINGETVEPGEDGRSYFIEVTEDMKDIAIEVKEQESTTMTMMVLVEGLDKFEDLVILDKDGENGKALAYKDQLEEGVPVNVEFTSLDLPLQIFGMWKYGSDYQMAVSIDGEVLEPVHAGPNSALYTDVNVENDQFMVISLTGAPVPAPAITLTVNEAEGVNVIADVEIEGESDVVNVEFVDGKAEVEGAQYIRIYNVEPYLIKSVVVDGEEVAAEEAGEFYFIEANAETKTIAIEVEKQEVVEMTMMVMVEGLDRFESLVIMDKKGENGKALAYKEQLDADALNLVHFTNLDLPLQVFGTWADGTDYKMEVTLDGEAIAPVQEGPTSALFMGIEVENEQIMTISLSGSVIPSEKVAITVNEPAGVQVLADVEVDEEYDVVNVEFTDGKVEVENAQTIRIYNVEPYAITSVKVNGEEIAAEEAGRYYFIEMTSAIETIDITVEEQEVVEMTMMVMVDGLDKFDTLVILDKDGENGKALAYKEQLDADALNLVHFTNLDLPLQVFGTWADGTDYKMEVTLDGEAIVPVQEGPTSALFMGIEVENEQIMTISLTGSVIPSEKVAITVNEAAGVQVLADVEVDEDYDVVNVEFTDGKAEVENAQTIRIYNVEPYAITSVKVNGEEIAAVEAGRYYFIEMTSAIETIDITVEEQEVVEMTMMVMVDGLDKFDSLVILDKDGENGKALAYKEQLDADALNLVHFTNLDLPLQVFGTWADGTDYKMEVTLDGEAIVPVQEGPTSALFMGIEVENEQIMTISLTGSVIPSEKVAITVNEPAGVQVIADTEDDVIDVEFVDGKAEVEGAQYVRIYNVDPYIISSVKVNGEEIAAEEGGRYYFIEMTAAIETIDITVQEQEVVEMSMMVYVNGLDKFEDLVILDKDGELGKAIASKENFEEDAYDGQALVNVWFTNLDLPLQVYGTWEDGTDYQMEVTIEGEPVAAAQVGPTSALFTEIYVQDQAFLTIELKGETSAINKVDAELKAGKWYNLQGIEVNKANLIPGNVYINAGQKYLVK